MNTTVPYRELTEHRINYANDKIVIEVMDKPGAGGANHRYLITLPDHQPTGAPHNYSINFQNGPINEAGINGLTHEVLLAILIDRLRSFQAGPYSCRENAIALTKLDEALLWLGKRTRDRMQRGVEGTSKV